MGNLEYNQWHALHSGDQVLNSVWHLNVTRKLNADVDLSDKVVLEIGCGRGAFANYLISGSNAPRSLFACDYSEKAVELAAERYGSHGDRLKWQRENTELLSFPDNTSDVVISCETIEHVPNPALALMELFRVLKPGGCVLLTCPSYFNFFGLWCFYRWAIGKPYTEGGEFYVNYPLMPRVWDWIKKAGFDVVEFRSSDIVLPLPTHYHFFRQRLFSVFRIFGLQTFISCGRSNSNQVDGSYNDQY
jgi:ubiquinone/menaquinone biosynthesis C-methylase UbiE